MKIQYIIPSIDWTSGGLGTSLKGLAGAITELNDTDTRILTLRDGSLKPDLGGYSRLRIYLDKIKLFQSFGFEPELLNALMNGDADISHSHGIWTYTSISQYKWAQKTGKPYIISPHGMLDPWALNNAPFKKKLAAMLFEEKHLKGASCIHALCKSEVEAIRNYGLNNPVCVIPNGVDIPESLPECPPPWQGKLPENRRILSYLGRLHVKKGLHHLIKAYASLHQRGTKSALDWSIVIAGWQEDNYGTNLAQLVKETGMEEHILILGSQFDDQQHAFYHYSDAFILPSVSEGLPMVVLEAWANRLPVLMTQECNIPEGFALDAALEIAPNEKSIASVLESFFGMPEEERRKIGERGQEFVRERFSWCKVADSMREVYSWVLEGGSSPDTVCPGVLSTN